MKLRSILNSIRFGILCRYEKDDIAVMGWSDTLQHKTNFDDMLDKITFDSSHTVLDVGCGSGIQTKRIAKHVKTAVGIEVHPGYLSRAKKVLKNKKTTHLIRCTGAKLPFPDDSFDRVICQGTFMWLLDPDEAERMISEMIRVTADNGIIFISEIFNYNKKNLFSPLKYRYKAAYLSGNKILFPLQIPAVFLGYHLLTVWFNPDSLQNYAKMNDAETKIVKRSPSLSCSEETFDMIIYV